MQLRKVFPIMAMLSMVLFTACKDDDGEPGVQPTVSSTDPENNAINFSVSGNISATFNTAMNEASVTDARFTVNNGTANISGTIEYTGTTASFIPDEDLEANTVYTATITTGIVN